MVFSERNLFGSGLTSKFRHNLKMINLIYIQYLGTNEKQWSFFHNSRTEEIDVKVPNLYILLLTVHYKNPATLNQRRCNTLYVCFKCMSTY